MTDEEAEAQRKGKAFPRPRSELALNAAFLPRGVLQIYLGMAWLGFVKMKSTLPTPGELWNSLWAFVSALFLYGFQRWQGFEDWAEVTWGKMAGKEIANEEIAFGSSVKTSVTFDQTPALGEGTGGLAEKGVHF